MEFERSLFRIHEKILQGQRSKKVLDFLFSLIFFICIFTFLRFVYYHKTFVNQSSILTSQIEYQLLHDTKISYSVIDGTFVFYNSTHKKFKNEKEINNLSEIDNQNSQVDQLSQNLTKNQTNQTNYTNKNDQNNQDRDETQEIISQRENGNLAQDDLYIIQVLKTHGYAENLKKLLIKEQLHSEDILSSDIFATYYYANEVGVFNMRNSQFKYQHNVKEHLIIMSLDDISQNLMVRMQIGWSLDFDVIMLNQILFTFSRQGELWYWQAGEYSTYRSNLKYDYDDNYSQWITSIILRKMGLLLVAFIGYAFVSVINGLLIRVAIHCSNIAIFPLVSFARRIIGAQLNRFQIAAIYRASPHIGSQAAYLDRSRRSKFELISAYLICLFAFYFMYGSCYFLWSQLIFPQMIARGINDMYFFYLNVLEFINLFFVRTRSNIKYFPKLILIMNLCFIMYINSYLYSAQYELFSFICWMSLWLVIGFLKYYEWVAINVWNPYGTYTPSINNPRSAYQLIFESQFMMGFDLQTMFHPLKFRERFNSAEQNRYDFLAQQEILGYDFDPQPPALPQNNNRRERNQVQQNDEEIQLAQLQRNRDQIVSIQINQPAGDDNIEDGQSQLLLSDENIEQNSNYNNRSQEDNQSIARLNEINNQENRDDLDDKNQQQMRDIDC